MVEWLKLQHKKQGDTMVEGSFPGGGQQFLLMNKVQSTYVRTSE